LPYLCININKVNTTQLQYQIVSSAQGLPDELLEEVLDFIQFLKIKTSKTNPDTIQGLFSTLNADNEQHLLDEFKDYKSTYPTE